MKRLLYLLVLSTVFLLPVAAMAADGSLGTSSTGESTLTLTVSDMVQVTSVGNLGFGTYSGAASDLDQNDDICVYRNDSGGAYQVTATSVEGAFQVEDGALNIDYTVYFNDVSGTGGEVELTYDDPLTTQSGANTTSLDCSGGSALNANFHVNFAQAALQAAHSGSYSGTLIFLVEPE